MRPVSAPSRCAYTHLANLPSDRDSHDDKLAVLSSPEDAPELVALGRDLGDVSEDGDRLRWVGVRLPLRHLTGEGSGRCAGVRGDASGVVAGGELEGGNRD